MYLPIITSKYNKADIDFCLLLESKTSCFRYSISVLLFLTWIIPIAAVVPLFFVVGSAWHSGRICSYFCKDLHAADVDEKYIVIYLTTSYAGTVSC